MKVTDVGAKGDSTLFAGTRGKPQGSLDLEGGGGEGVPKPTYAPSPKHDPKHPIGNPNPIKTREEGQRLLDTGYRDGKQIYNITDDGVLVKFQPDGTPENGYHSYKVDGYPDVPASVLRKMRDDNKITDAEYKKYSKGKGKDRRRK